MATVVGLFGSRDETQCAVEGLRKLGVSGDQISLVMRDRDQAQAAADSMDVGEGAAAGAVGGGLLGGLAGWLVGIGALAIPGVGPIIAAGPLAAALAGAGLGAATGGLIGALSEAGVSEDEARLYQTGIERGGILLTVDAKGANDAQVRQVMQRCGMRDVQTDSRQWQSDTNFRYGMTQSGMTRGATAASGAAAMGAQATRRVEGEEVIPVVEEELQVGKRQVQGGGARVEVNVEETPVQEQVELREERVTVDRRPVDRPIDNADAAFREGTFEVQETREVPVVNKQARVIEEIVIGKTVDTRTETVSDTVRRTDVNVEQLGQTATTQSGVKQTGTRRFEDFNNDFRSNYQSNFTNSGYTYEQFQPAYRYGYDLANHQAYRGRNWAQLEPEARRWWEESNPNTWDQFKDSVRYSWERFTQGR